MNTKPTKKQPSTEAVVLKALARRKTSATAAQLAKATKRSESAVRRALAALKRARSVSTEKGPKGTRVYSLSNAGTKSNTVTKAQLQKAGTTFRELRAVAAKKVPALVQTKLVVDASVHDSPRHFGMCRKLKGGGFTVHIAPELALKPQTVIRGVLMHELGHCAIMAGAGTKLAGKAKGTSYDDRERRADKAAEALFGAKIYYDKLGVETTSSSGKRPRPKGLR